MDNFPKEPSEIIKLANKVIETWRRKDEIVSDAVRLRAQDWEVSIPDEWKQKGVKTQHSALAREIPSRVVGTLTLREPVHARFAPDNDQAVNDHTSAIERWLDASFHNWNRTGSTGENAWTTVMDELANKGGCCVQSIYNPKDWAAGPDLNEEVKGEKKSMRPKKEWWRNEKGQPTEDEKDMHLEASTRAWKKAVDIHRQQAGSVIRRRIVPLEQTYPMIVDGAMVAMFIRRKVSPMELDMLGFDLVGHEAKADEAEKMGLDFTECWTDECCYYFLGEKEVRHRKLGKCYQHNHGFLPFAYQIGMPGEKSDYGPMGVPVISLIESNIKLIDALLTAQYNAIHAVGYPTWFMSYDPNSPFAITMANKKGQQFEVRSGVVNDFGPGRKPEPLTHPGMNADFAHLLEFLIEEVHRIIPRMLAGEAASTGYNTMQATVQAKSIFNPICDGAERLFEQIAINEMRMLERHPGPVYLDVLTRNHMSSKPGKVKRITLKPEWIGGYYNVSVSIDREMDRVTLGTWASGMVEKGIGDDEWAADLAGISDYQEMLRRRARDRVMKSPRMMEIMEAEAISEFGMRRYASDIAALASIVIDPMTGIVMLRLPDGRLVGPGALAPTANGTPVMPGSDTTPISQSPEAQAMNGAIMGGANSTAIPGAANMASSFGAGQGLPSASNPNAGSARGGAGSGGATPGLPQRQGMLRPEPVNPL